MEKTDFILRGGGTHATVVIDAIQSTGGEVKLIFDSGLSGKKLGIPIHNLYEADIFPNATVVVAIGDNLTRRKLADESKHNFGIVKDKTAIVSDLAQLGVGSMILQGSIVQGYAKIGKHVIVNTGAKVDHDVIVCDYVHVGPGAILCGLVEVGEGSLIGAGAVVITGIKIGRWAVIGAGAVVTENIPDYAIVVGNPGRVIKENIIRP